MEINVKWSQEFLPIQNRYYFLHDGYNFSVNNCTILRKYCPFLFDIVSAMLEASLCHMMLVYDIVKNGMFPRWGFWKINSGRASKESRENHILGRGAPFVWTLAPGSRTSKAQMFAVSCLKVDCTCNAQCAAFDTQKDDKFRGSKNEIWCCIWKYKKRYV